MAADTLFEHIVDALHVVPDYRLFDKKHIQRIEFRVPYRIVFNGIAEIKTIKEEHRIVFFMCFGVLKDVFLSTQSSFHIEKGLAIDSTNSVYLIT